MTYLVILRTLLHLYLNEGVDSMALFAAEPAVSLVLSFFLPPSSFYLWSAFHPATLLILSLP